MKPQVFCFLFFLSCCCFVQAQNLTGIWKGYFYSGYGLHKSKYQYEVQILQKPNNALSGVTYSYRTTVFYAKAAFSGIYMNKTQNLILKEDSLLEVKMLPASQVCAMTCYLQYFKNGNTETLEGEFSSITTADKSDCGAGYVYLERALESDFHKEDFLVKKKPAPKSNISSSQKQSAAKATPSTKQLSNLSPQKKTDSVSKTISPKLILKDSSVKKIKVPQLLAERENKLVNTLHVSSPNITIALYDNGEIDGDTITVYHNNELLAYKKGLSKEPVLFHITATPENAYHEFVMVANNLGRIPPNTALMVITAGTKRYELFLSANEQKNAKVVVIYEAQ